MVRTLRLTTPLMRGNDVRDLQRLLTLGPFGDFHPGGIDGEFGPLTAAAVYRAKFWIGYRKPNRSAAITVRRILEEGSKALPLVNRLRRARRLRARSQRLEFGHRAVTWARTQLGVHEHPDGSNRQPYGKRWGEDGVPWCGLFVCTAWSEAGGKITRELALRWDFVPQLHADARAGLQGVHVVGRDNIAAGDAVCLFNDGHVEIFDHWVNHITGTFRTIGGNTTAPGSNGSQSDGGHVADPVRTWSDVSASVRRTV